MRAVNRCYREQLVKHFAQVETYLQPAQRSPKEGMKTGS